MRYVNVYALHFANIYLRKGGVACKLSWWRPISGMIDISLVQQNTVGSFIVVLRYFQSICDDIRIYTGSCFLGTLIDCEII